METHVDRIVAVAAALAILYIAPLTIVLRRLGLPGLPALLFAVLLLVPLVNGLLLFAVAASGWPGPFCLKTITNRQQ